MSTGERYDRIKEIFLSLVDLSGEEQVEALERACSGDSAMLEELRGLLALSESPTGWLCPALRTRTLSGPNPELDLNSDEAGSRASGLRKAGNLAAELSEWSRFTDLVEVGAGGMGTVFRALDPRLKRTVALKFLTGAGAATGNRFRREAELQARVDHRNVLEIFETGEAAGHPFIAMRLVEGPGWQELRGKLSMNQTLDLFHQVAEGVQAAHEEGLIHRDLKPSNILVEGTTDGLRPYVADFGIAMATDDLGPAAEGPLGSPRYMAPEQLDGGFDRNHQSEMDHRVDLYGLGATFYEFLAGRPLFPDDSLLDLILKIRTEKPPSLAEVVPDVPAPLVAIVQRCLEKDPDQRYPSAKALAAELKRLLHSREKRPKRRRLLAALLAALVGGLILGTFGLWTAGVRSPGQLMERIGTGGPKGLAIDSTLSPRVPVDPKAAQLHAEGLSRLRHLDALGARNLLKTALALSPDHPQIHLALSKALLGLGHDAEARVEARTARELSRDLEEDKLLQIEGHFHFVARDWPRALEAFHRLWEHRPHDLEAGFSLAGVQAGAGDALLAMETLEALRQVPGADSEAPRLDLVEADVLSDLGRFGESLAAARRAAEEAANRSSPHIVAKARILESWSLRCLGRLDEAAQAAAEARIVATASGDQRGLSSALAMSAVVHRLQGRFAESRGDYEKALAIARESGDQAKTASFHGNLATMLVDQGKLAESLEHYAAALEIETELNHPSRTALLQVNMAHIQFFQGEFAEALSRYQAALEVFEETNDSRGKASTLGFMAELFVETGDLVRADQFGGESLRVAREMEGPAEEAQALNFLGWSDRSQGRYAQAAERHLRALETYRNLEQEFHMAGTRVLLQKVRVLQRREEESATLLAHLQAYRDGSEDPYTHLEVAAAEAEHAAAFDCSAVAKSASGESFMRKMLSLVAAVQSQGYASLPLQARLASGTLDLRCFDHHRGVGELANVIKDAESRGFVTLARQARKTLSESKL